MFGELIKKLRMDAGKSCREVAEGLGVSISYLSDVENGRRPPLTSVRCRKLVKVLGVKSNAIFMAAAKSKGYFELPFRPDSDLANSTAVALQLRWSKLTEDDFRALLKILKKETQGGSR